MASPLKGGCHHRGRDAIRDGFWYRCLCGFLPEKSEEKRVTPDGTIGSWGSWVASAGFVI